jgi:type VI secretion system secreted protein VgrG
MPMKNALVSLESRDELDVRSFAVSEAMSTAFRIEITAAGRDDLDLTKIVGHAASFAVRGRGGKRVWTGVCARINQTSVEPDGLSMYSLRVVPALWLLTHRTNHRIFQHKSVVEIAEALLAEWKITPVVRVDRGAFPKLESRSQYGESDYDFLRRLLADAGISFFFHAGDDDVSKVVLADAPQSGKPREGGPLPFVRSASGAERSDHVADVSISSEVYPGKSTVRDFDFRRPSYRVNGSHAVGEGPLAGLEEYRYAPGHSSVGGGTGGSTPVGDRDGVYRSSDKASAGAAEARVAAHAARANPISFSTSTLDLEPGSVFEMDGHPHPVVGKGKKLLVVSSYISGDIHSEWHAGGVAVGADKPHRPSLGAARGASSPGEAADPFGPAVDTKPRLVGVQSATVAGPKGEEIHTDEHGRVRLEFPWDRDASGDGKSSPWVRVAHAWAGPGFGNVSIPRVGQEVLVAFVDGDPDHPMVVGRMYNGASPMPYALPDNKTRTSWKSSSKGGANEISFEDRTDSELFYLQAQKDLHKIVKRHELEQTVGNRHIGVDGDLVLSAKGNVVIHAGGDVIVKGGPNIKLNPGAEPKKPDPPRELGSGKPAASPAPSPASASGSNAVLSKMSPNSPKSAQNAAANKAGAQKYQQMAKDLGKKHNLPPALVLGLMNRESNFGASLDANGWGDHGNGYGILQVDKRYHTPIGGPGSYEHADQALGVFDDTLSSVKAKHPDWTEEQQLAGAVAGYNSGAGNVQTQPVGDAGWAAMDRGTTGNDYSRDVWAQSQWYAGNLAW